MSDSLQTIERINTEINEHIERGALTLSMLHQDILNHPLVAQMRDMDENMSFVFNNLPDSVKNASAFLFKMA